jgi:hypothetical protein
LKLPFIDLHRASIAHHNKIGRDESMSYNFKEGDKTHFNKKGAEAITEVILEELKTAVPELATYLKAAVPAKQGAAVKLIENREITKARYDIQTASIGKD